MANARTRARSARAEAAEIAGIVQQANLLRCAEGEGVTCYLRYLAFEIMPNERVWQAHQTFQRWCVACGHGPHERVLRFIETNQMLEEYDQERVIRGDPPGLRSTMDLVGFEAASQVRQADEATRHECLDELRNLALSGEKPPTYQAAYNVVRNAMGWHGDEPRTLSGARLRAMRNQIAADRRYRVAAETARAVADRTIREQQEELQRLRGSGDRLRDLEGAVAQARRFLRATRDPLPRRIGRALVVLDRVSDP